MKFLKGRKIVTQDNCKIGDLVVRGRDWEWWDQDIHKGKEMVGRIVEIDCRWVWVRWENGTKYNYRVGVIIYTGLVYDLVFYEKPIIESL